MLELYPKLALPLPVAAVRALVPTPTLVVPVTTAAKAPLPIPILLVPVVFDDRTVAPIAMLPAAFEFAARPMAIPSAIG